MGTNLGHLKNYKKPRVTEPWWEGRKMQDMAGRAGDGQITEGLVGHAKRVGIF